MPAAMLCPVCSRAGSPLFTDGGPQILQCAACRHQWYGAPLAADHAAREYGDAYFNGGGVGYPDYLSEAALITAHGERYARRPELVRQRDLVADRPASMLDVGCAAGFTMQGFARQGWQVWGMDPNAAMVARVHDAAVGGACTGCFDAAAAPAVLAARKGLAQGFDLITMIQVVAHLTDLTQTLINLQALLAPQGLVLVETWNSQSRMARWLGRRWHEYSPPNVLHYFSPDSLDALMGRAGLVRLAHGRPLKRLNLGHARSLFDHKFGHTGLGRTLSVLSRPLPAGLNLPYPAEDLFWTLYQRQRPDRSTPTE